MQIPAPLILTASLVLAASSPAAHSSQPVVKSGSPKVGVGVWFGPGWYELLKGDQGYLQMLSLGGPFKTEQECVADLPTEPDFAKYSKDLHCFFYAEQSAFSEH
jgi:hypothetical protein